MFTEIANDPNQASRKGKSSSSNKTTRKCITATCLKNEHLEASKMLLKAGIACNLKSNGEEDCENTAIAVERVIADLIGLTTAVATALNNALKGDYDSDVDMDWVLIKEWCEFYANDLLVQTKSMIKAATPTLDTYGLFLPSRIGASLSQDLLQKGLKATASTSSDTTANAEDKTENETDADVCIEGEGDDDDVGEEKSTVSTGTRTGTTKDGNDNEDNENGYEEYDEYEYDEDYDFEE